MSSVIYGVLDRLFTPKNILRGVAGIAVLLIVLSAAYTVEPGHQVVVKRFGKTHREAFPGLNFRIPIVESLVYNDIRQLKKDIEIVVGTRDSLRILSKVSFNWRVNPDKLIEIVNTLGDPGNFVNVNIVPRITQASKEVFGQYSASELNEKRGVVAKDISSKLQAQLDGLPVFVTRVYLENFAFPKKYREEINNKEAAKQAVETERQLLLQHEIEAQQEVQTANAQNQVKKIIADAKLYHDEQKAKGYAAVARSLKEFPLVVAEQRIKNWNGVLPEISTEGAGFDLLLESAQ